MSRSIQYVSKLVKTATASGADVSSGGSALSRRHNGNGKTDLVLYVRIFSILGFTWVFGLLTILLPSDGDKGSWEYTVERILVLCYVIFNGLQGFYIFLVFTANRRVFNLYKGLCVRICHVITGKRN